MKSVPNINTSGGINAYKDFSIARDLLLQKLKINKLEKERANIQIRIAWLYDQWALSCPTHKKDFQIKAIKYFKIVLNNEPKNLSALNGLGTVYLHQKKYFEALEYYKRLHLSRRNAISYNALGNVYRQLGNYRLSEYNYRKSLRLSTNIIERRAAKFNLKKLIDEHRF